MDAPELRGVRILADMSQAQLGKLLEYGNIVQFSPPQTIVKQGDPSNALFLVLRGKVGAFVLEHGNEVHLRTIESGGHFGEVGLLEEGKRTATVKALEPCTLFCFQQNAFNELLKTPELATPFLHGLSRSLAIRLGDVTERLAVLWSVKDIWSI